MKIQSVPIDKINPAAYNPRKDLKPGDPEYEKLKKSIDEFDMVEPLVWNERSGNLVGGHQCRVEPVVAKDSVLLCWKHKGLEVKDGHTIQFRENR